MEQGQDLCYSLVKWLQTFKLKQPHSTVEEICDGAAMAEALSQIGPEWFNNAFISKIKTDVGSNWRLKVSNLKKIQDYILDYYQVCLNQQLNNFSKPDVTKIGEHCDRSELGRLLQLLLGCAVNCPQKQAYITIIMGMEESVQRVIMQAIQELENGSQASLGLPSEDFQLQRLMLDMDRLTEERDNMAQKCHELEMQISLLQEEKAGLQQELGKFETKITESPATASVSSSKYGLLRRELDALKEELFKAEVARDDARLRLETQDRTIIELQSRVDELQALADEARILKDEMDVLRETADKAGKYEATIETYKRKMEEFADLKRHYKLLEDKNAGYVQMNMDLEDELKRQGAWKSQAEAYKKQISELILKQKEEANHSDKLSFENSRLQEKLDALTREKERLVIERNLLKEANDELNCQIEAGVTKTESSHGMDEIGEDSSERLARLSAENRLLKRQQQESGDLVAVQALLDAANEQIRMLTQDSRSSNKRILELEAQLEELQANGSNNDSSVNKETQQIVSLTTQVQQLEEQLDQSQKKNIQLKEILSRKEADIAALEEKYKKSIEKAKAVISGLDPKMPNVALRQQPEKNLSTLQELKIITAAFHHLGGQKQREAADQRLSALGSGQSFLARQRAPVARKVANK